MSQNREVRGRLMSRGATAEIVEFSLPTEWYDRWWEPGALLAAVDARRQRFQFFEDMYRQELKPLREAWAASRFAAIRSQDRPVSIRLEPAGHRFPDFTLRVHKEVLPFELTEAYQEGRRRDQEYRRAAARKRKGTPPDIEQFDPGEEEKAAIKAIIRAIERKAGQHYSPAPHLLVYVNFFCVTNEPLVTNSLAFQLADRWSKQFKSCWLLWDNCIFRLWPRPAKIVNYTMNFCSVDDERMPIPNSKNQNSRLKDDQPPAP
jgi:hypothetical protein